MPSGLFALICKCFGALLSIVSHIACFLDKTDTIVEVVVVKILQEDVYV